jgi:hypothetical protein
MSFRIESNMNQVLQSLIIKLDDGFSIETEKALRMAGNDALAMVQDRVQQQGEGVNGKIQTKSSKRYGAYSKYYGKYRDTKGRQTGFIDFTFNGDLWRSWQILNSTPTMVEIGFNQSSQSDKAEYLEAYFGPVFALNREEEQKVLVTFEEEFEKELRL